MIIQHKDGLQMAVQLKLIKAIGKSKLTECLKNIIANGKEGSKNMFPTVLLREEGGLRVVPRFRDLHDGRDINDIFVTNQPDERKTLLCW